MYELITCDIAVPTANKVSNSTAETLFGPGIFWPANSEAGEDDGRVFDFDIWGCLSTAPSSPGSGTWKLKWGATILGTATIATLPSGLAAVTWNFKGKIEVCTSGSSGLIAAAGLVLVDNVGTPMSAGMPNPGTGASGQKSVNTQLQVQIGLSFTFGSVSTSNIVEADIVDIAEKR
jgi:hypothetical protein